MKKLFVLFFLIASPAFSICLTDCNTTKCASLDYYMKKCNKCKSVGKKCAQSFCQAHDGLCKNNQPLRPLSIATSDIREDRLHDVCMAPLFPKFSFQNNSNVSLTPDNLNTLNIIFFEQTGGNAHQRNIGSVSNVLANYFAVLYPELRKLPLQKAEEQVKLMTRMRFGKTLEQATNLDFHNMIEAVREDLFKRKGIRTQKVFEKYKNRNYPVTVTDIGCATEKLFKPIR